MRDFKGMKRQRGRNRGGGSSGGGGGGKPQAQNANRAFDSNGPEGSKVRGNAQHVFEKYQQLARDASAAGDRVLGENYLQHAEHYFRLLRAMQPTRPASEILGRDHFSSGFDIDFEDEGAQAQSEAADAASAASVEAGETPEWQVRENAQAAQNGGQNGGDQRPQQRDDRPRDDRPRDSQQRDDRPRYENRDRNDGGQGQGRRDRPWRDERPRDGQSRDGQPREGQQPRDGGPPRDAGQQQQQPPREDRPRYDDRPRDGGQAREDRPRYENRDRNRDERPREDRPERDPLAVIEPQAQAPLAAPKAAPERKARVLRDSEGGESHAPAFLQAPAPRAAAVEASDEVPKVRRRRAPRAGVTTASEGDDA
jgi:hypothetical protein